MDVSSTSPSNKSPELLKGWMGVPEGMTETSPDRISRTAIPMINSTVESWNENTSDRWLQSRNYLCLKNINIAYDFPRTLIKKLGLTGLQINASCENLVTFTALKGMNPMMGLSGSQSNYMVPARTFIFGLTVNL